MNLESHEVFRSVVEYGSLTKAANTLHMTQSTASRHLQALEDEYGGLLFERSTVGLKLTVLGKALYPYSCDLLACHLRAKEELLRLRQQGGGLSVGATLSIGEYMLPKILGVIHRRYTETDIHMRIANSEQITRDLLRHRIDVGLVEGTVVSSDDIIVSPWMQDELVLVCSPMHHFASSGVQPITVADIACEPFLCRELGSGTRQITERALEEAGVLSSIHCVMELGSIQAIKSAIEEDLGIAFLPKQTVQCEHKTGRIVIIPITDFTITRTLQILQRVERYPRYMVKKFLEVLNEFVS